MQANGQGLATGGAPGGGMGVMPFPDYGLGMPPPTLAPFPSMPSAAGGIEVKFEEVGVDKSKDDGALKRKRDDGADSGDGSPATKKPALAGPAGMPQPFGVAPTAVAGATGGFSLDALAYAAAASNPTAPGQLPPQQRPPQQTVYIAKRTPVKGASGSDGLAPATPLTPGAPGSEAGTPGTPATPASGDGLSVQRGKTKVKPPRGNVDWTCAECGVGWRDTPGQRRGPKGPGTLCNKCGVRHARAVKARNPPVPSTLQLPPLPTLQPSVHQPPAAVLPGPAETSQPPLPAFGSLPAPAAPQKGVTQQVLLQRLADIRPRVPTTDTFDVLVEQFKTSQVNSSQFFAKLKEILGATLSDEFMRSLRAVAQPAPSFKGPGTPGADATPETAAPPEEAPVPPAPAEKIAPEADRAQLTPAERQTLWAQLAHGKWAGIADEKVDWLKQHANEVISAAQNIGAAGPDGLLRLVDGFAPSQLLPFMESFMSSVRQLSPEDRHRVTVSMLRRLMQLSTTPDWVNAPGTDLLGTLWGHVMELQQSSAAMRTPLGEALEPAVLVFLTVLRATPDARERQNHMLACICYMLEQSGVLTRDLDPGTLVLIRELLTVTAKQLNLEALSGMAGYEGLISYVPNALRGECAYLFVSEAMGGVVRNLEDIDMLLALVSRVSVADIESNVTVRPPQKTSVSFGCATPHQVGRLFSSVFDTALGLVASDVVRAVRMLSQAGLVFSSIPNATRNCFHHAWNAMVAVNDEGLRMQMSEYFAAMFQAAGSDGFGDATAYQEAFAKLTELGRYLTEVAARNAAVAAAAVASRAAAKNAAVAAAQQQQMHQLHQPLHQPMHAAIQVPQLQAPQLAPQLHPPPPTTA